MLRFVMRWLYADSSHADAVPLLQPPPAHAPLIRRRAWVPMIRALYAVFAWCRCFLRALERCLLLSFAAVYAVVLARLCHIFDVDMPADMMIPERYARALQYAAILIFFISYCLLQRFSLLSWCYLCWYYGERFYYCWWCWCFAIMLLLIRYALHVYVMFSCHHARAADAADAPSASCWYYAIHCCYSPWLRRYFVALLRVCCYAHVLLSCPLIIAADIILSPIACPALYAATYVLCCFDLFVTAPDYACYFALLIFALLYYYYLFVLYVYHCCVCLLCLRHAIRYYALISFVAVSFSCSMLIFLPFHYAMRLSIFLRYAVYIWRWRVSRLFVACYLVADWYWCFVVIADSLIITPFLYDIAIWLFLPLREQMFHCYAVYAYYLFYAMLMLCCYFIWFLICLSFDIFTPCRAFVLTIARLIDAPILLLMFLPRATCPPRFTISSLMPLLLLLCHAILLMPTYAMRCLSDAADARGAPAWCWWRAHTCWWCGAMPLRLPRIWYFSRPRMRHHWFFAAIDSCLRWFITPCSADYSIFDASSIHAFVCWYALILMFIAAYYAMRMLPPYACWCFMLRAFDALFVWCRLMLLHDDVYMPCNADMLRLFYAFFFCYGAVLPDARSAMRDARRRMLFMRAPFMQVYVCWFFFPYICFIAIILPITFHWLALISPYSFSLFMPCRRHYFPAVDCFDVCHRAFADYSRWWRFSRLLLLILPAYAIHYACQRLRDVYVICRCAVTDIFMPFFMLLTIPYVVIFFIAFFIMVFIVVAIELSRRYFAHIECLPLLLFYAATDWCLFDFAYFTLHCRVILSACCCCHSFSMLFTFVILILLWRCSCCLFHPLMLYAMPDVVIFIILICHCWFCFRRCALYAAAALILRRRPCCSYTIWFRYDIVLPAWCWCLYACFLRAAATCFRWSFFLFQILMPAILRLLFFDIAMPISSFFSPSMSLFLFILHWFRWFFIFLSPCHACYAVFSILPLLIFRSLLIMLLFAMRFISLRRSHCWCYFSDMLLFDIYVWLFFMLLFFLFITPAFFHILLLISPLFSRFFCATFLPCLFFFSPLLCSSAIFAAYAIISPLPYILMRLPIYVVVAAFLCWRSRLRLISPYAIAYALADAAADIDVAAYAIFVCRFHWCWCCRSRPLFDARYAYAMLMPAAWCWCCHAACLPYACSHALPLFFSLFPRRCLMLPMSPLRARHCLFRCSLVCLLYLILPVIAACFVSIFSAPICS